MLIVTPGRDTWGDMSSCLLLSAKLFYLLDVFILYVGLFTATGAAVPSLGPVSYPFMPVLRAMSCIVTSQGCCYHPKPVFPPYYIIVSASLIFYIE